MLLKQFARLPETLPSFPPTPSTSSRPATSSRVSSTTCELNLTPRTFPCINVRLQAVSSLLLFFLPSSPPMFGRLYINTTSESTSNLRSGAFLAGIGICFTLFIKAGNAFF